MNPGTFPSICPFLSLPFSAQCALLVFFLRQCLHFPSFSLHPFPSWWPRSNHFLTYSSCQRRILSVASAVQN
ncbi:hypothetical protein B0H19DRAFT_333749 [Mycena capillaripes]|nr:hypothetical protein B0H19DRAFT_333749 [Mycena capillaripes]